MGACGVEEGADEVEDGAVTLGGEIFSGLDDGFEGGVVVGGEEEADACVFEAVAEAIGWEVDADAEGFEDVGAAGFGGDAAVAVFDDDCASGCGEEHGGGGDVEEVEFVAAGSADVECGAG